MERPRLIDLWGWRGRKGGGYLDFFLFLFFSTVEIERFWGVGGCERCLFVCLGVCQCLCVFFVCVW